MFHDYHFFRLKFCWQVVALVGRQQIRHRVMLGRKNKFLHACLKIFRASRNSNPVLNIPLKYHLEIQLVVLQLVQVKTWIYTYIYMYMHVFIYISIYIFMSTDFEIRHVNFVRELLLSQIFHLHSNKGKEQLQAVQLLIFMWEIYRVFSCMMTLVLSTH